jgi:TolB protein
MKKQYFFGLILAFFAQNLIAQTTSAAESKHLKNLRQLTFGGDNAEAYWSPNSQKLTLQSNRGLKADQIFWIDVKKASNDSLYKKHLVSTGFGRTTCSYFMPDQKHILYGSTHGASDTIPSTGDLRSGGRYMWNIFETFDIYVADLKGKITSKLTNLPGYDAEATVSPQGDKIVFTSTRGGDLDLWIMDIDGKNAYQVTHGLGYDGGAFFSPDGKKLVFRNSRPKTEAEIKDYQELLAKNLVAPTNMEICTINVDGSDYKQLTNLGKANWAPFFTPKGDKIIFSSNHASKKGYDFQLFLINTDGTGLEQVTTESYFNSFAMFSPDGKKISFSSNRDNHGTRDTNVFVADWVE